MEIGTTIELESGKVAVISSEGGVININIKSPTGEYWTDRALTESDMIEVRAGVRKEWGKAVENGVIKVVTKRVKKSGGK